MQPHATIQQAQAAVMDPHNQPGGTCRQCFGNLVRVDGKLSCGRCGWPADKEIPARNPAASVLTQNGDLRKQVQALQEENDALRAENEALKKATPAAQPLHTDLLPAAETLAQPPNAPKKKGR